jgi:hypothetical protein
LFTGLITASFMHYGISCGMSTRSLSSRDTQAKVSSLKENALAELECHQTRPADKPVLPLSNEGSSIKTPGSVLEAPPCFEEQTSAN